MARIRSLKPSFFDHDGLAACSPHARLAFQGLWLHADREGRLKDEPTRLRVRIFPYEPNVQMDGLLNELEAGGFLLRYEVAGARYLSLPGFLEHQRPHPKEPPSAIPAPSSRPDAVEKHGEPWKDTVSTGTIPSSTRGKGREGNGCWKGAGTEAADEPPRPPTLPRVHPRSPLAWDRQHGTHVAGFCDWVCLPESLADEFAGRLPATEDRELRRAKVEAWAHTVRADWQHVTVGDESVFEFWKLRWKETHGTTRAAAPKSDLREVIARLDGAK